MKEREFRYLALLDYYSEKKTEIEVCENCLCETIYNYYSLYYIELGHKNIDNKYSFQPYPIGEKLLPDKKSLPKVVHEENEGNFRFGRTLFENEIITFSEKKVLKNFNIALERYTNQITEDSMNINNLTNKL